MVNYFISHSVAKNCPQVATVFSNCVAVLQKTATLVITVSKIINYPIFHSIATNCPPVATVFLCSNKLPLWWHQCFKCPNIVFHAFDTSVLYGPLLYSSISCYKLPPFYTGVSIGHLPLLMDQRMFNMAQYALYIRTVYFNINSRK